MRITKENIEGIYTIINSVCMNPFSIRKYNFLNGKFKKANKQYYKNTEVEFDTDQVRLGGKYELFTLSIGDEIIFNKGLIEFLIKDENFIFKISPNDTI